MRPSKYIDEHMIPSTIFDIHRLTARIYRKRRSQIYSAKEKRKKKKNLDRGRQKLLGPFGRKFFRLSFKHSSLFLSQTVCICICTGACVSFMSPASAALFPFRTHIHYLFYAGHSSIQTPLYIVPRPFLFTFVFCSLQVQRPS